MINKHPYFTNKLTDLSQVNAYRNLAVEHGIIDPSWEWLLTPVVYSSSHIQLLEALLHQVELLMEDIWKTYCYRPESLMQELGIPTWMHQIIKLDECAVPMPLRWDAIYAGEQWKILEINTGYCLGGLNGFSINEHRSAFYSNCNTKSHIIPLDNAFRFMSDNICHVTSVNTIIPVIETSEGYEQYGFYLDNFVRCMNEHSQFRFIPGRLSDFSLEGDDVIFKGNVVTHFIPMFNLYELSDVNCEHRLFIKALLDRKIMSLLGFREIIFSNKGFIPYLVRYAAATLSLEEAKKIAELFPFSAVLKEENIAYFYYGDFILKPAEGYGGNGIVCSWLCSSKEWIRALKHSLNSNCLWVVQERVIGSVSYMQSVDLNGLIKDGDASVVHGFITLKGKMIANLTRAAIGVMVPGVINAHQGAAFGLSGVNSSCDF